MIRQLALRWAIGCALAALCGCSAASLAENTTCSTAAAVTTTGSLVKDQILKSAIAEAKTTPDVPVEDSALRAAVNLLKVDITSIRTTKVDPNSTKRFCEAQAKVVVPLNVISDADRVRTLKNATSVNDAAAAASVERGADTFTFNISYDVQPTDDRTQIYAESDTVGGQAPFFGAVVVDYLMKPRVEAAMVAFQQQQQAQQQAQAQLAQQAAQQALDEAKAENTLSQQAINAVWTSIDPATRGQILDVQRAWVKGKTETCRLQAAAASTDPLQVETARIKCDTAANQQRQDWLKQYVTAGE